MGQHSVELFLGRLITDDDFRDLAGQSCSQACRAHGFNLSDEELGLLERVDLERFVPLCELIDDDLRRCRRARYACREGVGGAVFPEMDMDDEPKNMSRETP